MNDFAKACFIGLGTSVVLTIVLLSMWGCNVQRPCPAYVTNPHMGGTYDPNKIVCGEWYEWLGEYWYTTLDKREALDYWADISSRPMYFDASGEFNFSVRSKDGYIYTIWSMISCWQLPCEVPDTVYNITAVPNKKRAPI